MSSKPSVSEFDTLLKSGAGAYNTAVGQWWATRCCDTSHRRAYQQVVQLTQNTLKQLGLPAPQLAVDYACGQGILIGAFLQSLQSTAWVGLDGSDRLLEDIGSIVPSGTSFASLLPRQAFAPRGPQVRLVRTFLPDFSLPAGRADLVVLAFPNLIPDDSSLEIFNRNGYCNAKDSAVARMLGRFREIDPEDEVDDGLDADERYDELLTTRVFSRNLRRLLKPGGLLVRVEYATVPRAELSELTRTRLLFAEGALDRPIKDRVAPQFFQFLSSHYFRSKVILDVFHQTGNPEDRHGGYTVSFFQACN